MTYDIESLQQGFLDVVEIQCSCRMPSSGVQQVLISYAC